MTGTSLSPGQRGRAKALAPHRVRSRGPPGRLENARAMISGAGTSDPPPASTSPGRSICPSAVRMITRSRSSTATVKGIELGRLRSAAATPSAPCRRVGIEIGDQQRTASQNKPARSGENPAPATRYQENRNCNAPRHRLVLSSRHHVLFPSLFRADHVALAVAGVNQLFFVILVDLVAQVGDVATSTTLEDATPSAASYRCCQISARDTIWSGRLARYVSAAYSPAPTA